MAYQSLLGYAKDGIAEVVASTESTMNDINHWALDAYRTLKLYSPATGELKTWLEANAVKMPIEGTWVFNAAPDLPSSEIDISPISSSTDISVLEPEYDTANGPLLLTGINVSESSIGFYTYLDGDEHLYQAYGNGAWEDNSMRAITFTEPVQYEGNEEFIRWFVDNATQSGGVSFRLNDTITLSIKPQNVTWTSDRIAKVPSYYCAPYFINNFKIGDKSYTYFGAHKDATIFKSYRQRDGETTYETTAGLTMYLNILPDENFYTQNRLTGQTSIIYPDYPLSVDANTSGIILVFEELPTGSFLTWLNNNATLIPTIKQS